VKKREPVVQIIEGKWYALGSYSHSVCCGCGLTHRVEYMLDKGRIFERVYVDTRMTRNERRKHGIVVLRKENGRYRSPR
jgi:hypothetical protein